MAFLNPRPNPPGLGFVFQDAGAGSSIFQRWRELLGERDVDELIRVSIVEGDIPGQSPGYSVHLCVDPQGVMERLERSDDVEVDLDMRALSGHAARRMQTTNTETLQVFKDLYYEREQYSLVAVVRDASGFAPLYETQVLKKQLLLRRADQITDPKDPDSPLLHAR